jgi:hypothetical protein
VSGLLKAFPAAGHVARLVRTLVQGSVPREASGSAERLATGRADEPRMGENVLPALVSRRGRV